MHVDGDYDDLRAVALPPLRPAAFFCAVVPPCEELLRDELEWDFFPPRLDESDEFAIFAARSFDIPLSFSASYCFSFFTLELLPGMTNPLSIEIRRLSSDDGDRLAALATYPDLQERSELLADPRTFVLVALDGEEPAGFVPAYELLRRHGPRSQALGGQVEEVHRWGFRYAES
jgi:hypothetical protein